MQGPQRKRLVSEKKSQCLAFLSAALRERAAPASAAASVSVPALATLISESHTHAPPICDERGVLGALNESAEVTLEVPFSAESSLDSEKAQPTGAAAASLPDDCLESLSAQVGEAFQTTATNSQGGGPSLPLWDQEAFGAFEIAARIQREADEAALRLMRRQLQSVKKAGEAAAFAASAEATAEVAQMVSQNLQIQNEGQGTRHRLRRKLLRERGGRKRDENQGPESVPPQNQDQPAASSGDSSAKEAQPQESDYSSELSSESDFSESQEEEDLETRSPVFQAESQHRTTPPPRSAASPPAAADVKEDSLFYLFAEPHSDAKTRSAWMLGRGVAETPSPSKRPKPKLVREVSPSISQPQGSPLVKIKVGGKPQNSSQLPLRVSAFDTRLEPPFSLPGIPAEAVSAAAARLSFSRRIAAPGDEDVVDPQK